MGLFSQNKGAFCKTARTNRYGIGLTQLDQILYVGSRYDDAKRVGGSGVSGADGELARWQVAGVGQNRRSVHGLKRGLTEEGEVISVWFWWCCGDQREVCDGEGHCGCSSEQSPRDRRREKEKGKVRMHTMAQTSGTAQRR